MLKKIMCGSICLLLVLLLCSCGGKKIREIEKTPNNAFAPDDNWELTFSEDFNGDSLDRNTWHYAYSEEGVRRGGWWVDDAVLVENGNLVIRTEYRENGKFGAGWYTGGIESSPREAENGQPACTGFSQTGGYFEARCKVPATYGNWAAFWLMPVGDFKDDVFGTGEDGAEIDIFESPFMYWKEHQNVISHAIHVDGYGEELASIGSDYIEVENLYDEFHTFGLKWDETGYTFYVDGYETWHTKDALDTVCNVPAYLLLSCEVAGIVEDEKPLPGQERNADGDLTVNWAGTPEDNDKTKAYDFLVDYVKVYREKA